MKIKNWLVLVVLYVSFQSCQFFETEKISSETFLKDEIKSINWKDVDQYPIFLNCDTFTEKKEQKSCFESTLSAHLYQVINSEKMRVTSDLNETFVLDFLVDEKGKLAITSMKIDSLLKVQIPLLATTIMEGIKTLQPIAPAYKRGIPVKTTFRLPLVIKTSN
ncbi:MAG: hypothetical protein HN507_03895 [Flavobacteriaceae bacterium]|jgi:hypothetical protein|nr:hypothetical protein [Flavobacteriaceae bacterium]